MERPKPRLTTNSLDRFHVSKQIIDPMISVMGIVISITVGMFNRTMFEDIEVFGILISIADPAHELDGVDQRHGHRETGAGRRNPEQVSGAEIPE